MTQSTTNEETPGKNPEDTDAEVEVVAGDGAPEDDVAADADDADDQARDLHDADPHDQYGGIGGSGFAAMSLRFLIIVLVVFGLSLWLVPMAAPHLPASIARHLMPGQKELDTRLAGLDEEVRASTASALEDVATMRKEVAALTERLAAAEAAVERAGEEAAAARAGAEASAKAATTATVAEDVVTKAEQSARHAAEAADTATVAATEAGKVAAAATRDTASLSRRMTSFEARVAALSDELGALGENLAAAPADDDGGPTPELVAAFAAMKARVDGLAERVAASENFLTAEDADRFATQDDLRSARTALQAEVQANLGKWPEPGEVATDTDLDAARKALENRIGALDQRLAAAEETAAAASASAEAASIASRIAEGKVETAIRDASVRSAVAALLSRLQNGVAFADALAELEQLTGQGAPEALTAAGATGVATTDALLRTFGRNAQAAISADIQADAADDGLFGKASARLQSVVAGRPKTEQEGDDTGAIVSRIEARLRDGTLAEALSETERLSGPAKAALADWLDRLRGRVDADAAAAAYIAELTRQQG